MAKHPVVVDGIVRWREVKTPSEKVVAQAQEPLLREVTGDVLRSVRNHKGRTLREVSKDSKVSLGYLSEVERGKKEASSELLAAICAAMGIPVYTLLRIIADRLEMQSKVQVPDHLPADFDTKISV
ncbi:MAG: helix-turn-helix transcriptional regulator [Micrococcaceae bacterium]